MTLYWAYGSNISKEQMLRRCPDARPVCPIIVDDARLVFRFAADVVWDKGSSTPGALWDITDRCERSLDHFEGVAAGTYLKRWMDVRIKGKKRPVLYYQMSISRGVLPPSEEYIETIARGYRDFGLDLADLDAALQRSWDDRHVTDRMARKHWSKGSPRLARPMTSTNPRKDATC